MALSSGDGSPASDKGKPSGALPRGRGRVCSVLRTAAWGAAAGALLAQAGRWSNALDLFSHLAPLGLVFGPLALLSAPFTPDRRIQSLLSGALAIAGSVCVIAATPPAPAPSPGQGALLKVIQFNAWRRNAQLPELVDWLVAEKPDVVFLEEVTPLLRDRLLARTGWHVAGRRSTVMIFSPHPLRAVNVRPVAHASVEPTWVNALIDVPGGRFEAVATHFTWPLYDLRDAQGPLLRRVLEQLPSDTLVMGGDFNSTPWSFVRRRNDASLPVSRRDPAIPTWPALLGRPIPLLPLLPIDHVYAGPRWQTVSVRAGPRLGSDHLPLVVVLRQAATNEARPQPQRNPG